MKKSLNGRPPKYDEKFKISLLGKLKTYLKKTDIPILAEFAYQSDIPRSTLYEFEELSDTIKKLRNKKEANLERKSLNGEINTTMAIFSLKQLGAG